jgi:uncharacterized protein
MIRPVVLSLFLVAAAVPALADFEDGWHAYERGDYATALREWTLLAQQGHKIAQHNLGIMYVRGYGVQQDFSLAARWFIRAANQGYAPSELSLGLAYLYGNGVPADESEAAKWFRRASEQGHGRAQ